MRSLTSFARLAILASAALFLTGCISFEFPDRVLPRAGGKSLDGAAAGARFESFLTYSDRRAIERSAWAAVEDAEVRATHEWTNAATGSFGSVRAGEIYLVGFNSGSEIEAPLGLDTAPFLEPKAGNYITNANTNVRLSPQIKGVRAAMLPKGTTVQVVGYDPVARWYLIAHQGRVVGYVFADLITRIEGGDLLLAGGGQQQPKLCRELIYKTTFETGKQDEWLNGACREGGSNWRVVGGRTLEAAM